LVKNKKIAIVQSNYIPWKGYFDIINMVDEFILYDDVQYTRRDWRNRNKIKTSLGTKWITIPVEVKGKFFQKIKDTKVSDKNWGKNHWKTIYNNYSKARYFNEYRELFEELYLNSDEKYLSIINYKFICFINKIIGNKTKISFSSDYELINGKMEKILHLCKCAGASEYISGPMAKNYIDEYSFKKENITLTWMDYSDYREYNQLYPPFTHYVSIIDLIFNEGPDFKKYMKSSTK
jgi:hypothetical protein